MCPSPQVLNVILKERVLQKNYFLKHRGVLPCNLTGKPLVTQVLPWPFLDGTLELVDFLKAVTNLDSLLLRAILFVLFV